MAKNNNNTPQTRHVYFALDSDVLTNLADLDYLRKKYPEDKEIYQLRDKVDHSKQRSLSYNFNFYNELLNIAKSGDVRFLITPTAFFECKHIPYLLGFMKKYCYVPKLSIANYKHQEYLVRELAKTYCNDYYIDEINEDGEVVSVKHKAPLSPEYNAHYGDLVPSNDAYIMAEATVFNAVLLTENGKHLCFREDKPNDRKNNDYAEETTKNARSKGIVDINIQKGYYQEGESEDSINYIVSRPYTIATIGPLLKYFKENAKFPNSNDNVFARLVDEEAPLNPRL